MSIWDDRILEYISEEDSATPKKLKESGYIRVTSAHIGRRMRKLAEHGLLTNLGNSVYVITERGEQYLAGELDTHKDLPDDVPSAGESGDEGTGESVNGV